MRALMFGEDFTSDPVSRVLGYVLRYFSKGHLAVDVQLVSQVFALPCCSSALPSSPHDIVRISEQLCRAISNVHGCFWLLA